MNKIKTKNKSKKHKKWFYALCRQRISIIIMLLLQLVFLTYIIISTSLASQYIYVALTVLSLIVALHIVVNQNEKTAYKLTWTFIILAAPVFGGLFYLLFRWQTSEKRVHKRFSEFHNKTKELFRMAPDRLPDAEKEIPDQTPAIRYLQESANFPVYTHTKTKFLAPGEVWYEDMLGELKKAEKYIFLEYFIIEEGVFWDSMLEILKEKAEAGVDVRLIYDDMGCFLTLPKDYSEYLESVGIKCVVFNKFRPVFTGLQNNRDHRKITVIDGKVAYTGGANLADEYINLYEKHGYWKDASIKITGDAVWSLTLIFLGMWAAITNTDEDFASYAPNPDITSESESDGFVQPYADSPLDKENVGEHVYLHIIQNAKKYIYINTPYLIVDETMLSELKLAAKSGVDVRIITPGVYDKLLVHITTRSFYRELLAAGIKIYEYKGGFNHAKTFVSDGKVATVGTTNLDFRSLYLHFECGVRLADSSTISDIYNDFVNTLENCSEITPQMCKSNPISRILQDILRLFAPLM